MMEESTVSTLSDDLRHIEIGELEDELVETHRKVMWNETRLDLLNSLLRQGHCTRDVYSFICKQADQCENISLPDLRTMHSAMKLKIHDIKTSINGYHRKRRQKEGEALRLLDGRSSLVRKKLRQIRQTIKGERELIKQKYQKKISHYHKTQVRLNKDHQRVEVKQTLSKSRPTIPPRHLGEYSTLSIFGACEDLKKPDRPLGPYITDTSIKLTRGEVKLLSKDPKFSLKYDPDPMTTSIEIERMNSKARFELGSKNKNYKKPRITTGEGKPIEWEENLKESTGDPLLDLFRQCEGKFVFNPLEKSIDFTRRKATDYKLNRNIILPQPLTNDREFQCELRRKAYMEALETHCSVIRSSRKKEFKKINAARRRKRKKKRDLEGNTNLHVIVSGSNGEMLIQPKEKEVKEERERCEAKKLNCGTNGEVINRKKSQKTPINLSKCEIDALRSLKKKIKDGSLVVTRTDKSSRFAVMSKKQYLESGWTHTAKDQKITWKEVTYLQNQINSHVWWLANCVGYASETDSKRMMGNIQNHSLEVPEMALLVKDHKQWSKSSKKPVPTRPVVSGNNGINTHLSEFISELLEPLVMELGSGEVSSTEEALSVITDLNKRVSKGDDLSKVNVLDELKKNVSGEEYLLLNENQASLVLDTSEVNDVDNLEKNVSVGEYLLENENLASVVGRAPDLDSSDQEEYSTTLTGTLNNSLGLNDSDMSTVGVLEILFEEAKVSGNIPCQTPESKKRDLCDIRSYFQPVERKERSQTLKGSNYYAWAKEQERRLKTQANTEKTFNAKLAKRCKAAKLWGEIETNRLNEMLKKADDREKNISIQDFSQTPILLGGDAVALYPSMEAEGSSEMVYEAVMDSKIAFRNINYDYLLVYLFLILGIEGLREYKLGHLVPRRKSSKECNARSLSATVNRDMGKWSIPSGDITEQEKKKLVALMLKVAVLAAMDSTCYTFGGQLYKQVEGSGIGLRSSACVAKILMGMIDRLWARAQSGWNIKLALYLRYIDDLRSYLFPIAKGWSWIDNMWVYDENSNDNRTPMRRTCEEIMKTLNSTVKFITFTTECEEDFSEKFLPTLDFQTRVQQNGEILFKFFKKPMANNITIQFGTALPKNTVFSSLRQELVRRMLNCDKKLDWDERLSVIEEFIQLLINSGHSYPFIKAVTLQALTKYKNMLQRDMLDENHKRHMPLYRARTFMNIQRKLSKCVEGMTWFRGLNFTDIYRKEWKKKLHAKKSSEKQSTGKPVYHSDKILSENAKQSAGKPVYYPEGAGTNGARDIVCAMFVPPSQNLDLFERIVNIERDLADKTEWSVKILEQSGTPLALNFVPKFPLIQGCPKGSMCTLCENDGRGCGGKSVVYRASCNLCSRQRGLNGNISYIGETSRPLRERVCEHMDNLRKGDVGSFQIDHWMNFHGLDAVAPTFKFEIVAQFSDPLRRQICEGLHILESGAMNKKHEFNSNVICRLQVPDNSLDTDANLNKLIESRRTYKEKLKGFVDVMTVASNVIFPRRGQERTTECTKLFNYRSNPVERMTDMGKRKRELEPMDTSTPTSIRREVVLIPLEESPIEQQTSEQQSEEEASKDIETPKRAGISHELDSAALTPVKELSSETQGRNLLIGAVDLTNAAFMGNSVGEMLNETVPKERKVKENSLFSPFDSRASSRESGESSVPSLSPWELSEEKSDVHVKETAAVLKEQKPPLILGANATQDVLDSMAIDVQSPKRPANMDVGTPKKRVRVTACGLLSASPNLRSTGTVGEKKKKMKKNKLAAKFPPRDQPLIREAFLNSPGGSRLSSGQSSESGPSNSGASM